MGIPSLSTLETVRSASALHLVVRGDINIPRPLDKAPADQPDTLGCARGIIVALGFQVGALLLGFALWKLHFLFH
jgi:hypothetical protein